MSLHISKLPDDNYLNYKRVYSEVSTEYASDLQLLLPYEASNLIIDKMRERLGDEAESFEAWLVSEGYETSSSYDWRWLFWDKEERVQHVNELALTAQNYAKAIGGKYAELSEWINSISFQITSNEEVYMDNKIFRAIIETFQVVIGIIHIMSRATEEAHRSFDDNEPLFRIIDQGADYAKDLLQIVNEFLVKHKEHADLGISDLSQGVINHDSQHMVNLFFHFTADLKKGEMFLTRKLTVGDLSNDIFAYAAYYRLLLKLRLRKEDSADLDRVAQEDILQTFPPKRSGEATVAVNVDIKGKPDYVNIESFVVLRTLILNAKAAVEIGIKGNELTAFGADQIDVQISGMDGSTVLKSLGNEFAGSIRAEEDINPNGNYALFRVTNSISAAGEEKLLHDFNQYADDIMKDPNASGSHGLQLGIYMTRSDNQGGPREVVFMGITFTGSDDDRKVNIYMVCPVN